VGLRVPARPRVRRDRVARCGSVRWVKPLPWCMTYTARQVGAVEQPCSVVGCHGLCVVVMVGGG
jgi:hypothetical protein